MKKFAKVIAAAFFVQRCSAGASLGNSISPTMEMSYAGEKAYAGIRIFNKYPEFFITIFFMLPSWVQAILSVAAMFWAIRIVRRNLFLRKTWIFTGMTFAYAWPLVFLFPAAYSKGMSPEFNPPIPPVAYSLIGSLSVLFFVFLCRSTLRHLNCPTAEDALSKPKENERTTMRRTILFSGALLICLCLLAALPTGEPGPADSELTDGQKIEAFEAYSLHVLLVFDVYPIRNQSIVAVIAIAYAAAIARRSPFLRRAWVYTGMAIFYAWPFVFLLPTAFAAQKFLDHEPHTFYASCSYLGSLSVLAFVVLCWAVLSCGTFIAERKRSPAGTGDR